mgnify:CR=1 FL=1
MSSIRVTYSGLIAFVISIVSVFTGLVFTIIVTRQLTQEEFGTWGIIGAMTGYMLIFEPIINHWATREIARGKESGKTALFSTGLFSTIAIVGYMIMIILFEKQIEVNFDLLLVGLILIPLAFFRASLQSIAMGYKPEIRSYGILAFEIVKIPVGLLLIYFLELGLMGAIITTAFATLSTITVLTINVKEKLKDNFNVKFLKSWIKRFWIPTYPKISNKIMNLDVVAFTLIGGSIADLAYWTAANAISKVVAHADQISSPIYGKLLGGGKVELLQNSIIRTLYFSFPLVAMAIIFARPGLFILNPLYEIASSIVVVLSITVFFQTLNGLFESALEGTEKVDLNEKATVKEYIKSRLFYLPTIRLIQRSVYLSAVVIVFILFAFNVENKIELIFYWAIVSLTTRIPLTVYLYILMRKHLKTKIQLLPIIKYLLSAVLMFGLTYFIMNEFIEYKISIFEFLPQFLIYVTIAVGGYLALTYLIDQRTRFLFKSIVKEIFKRQIS